MVDSLSGAHLPAFAVSAGAPGHGGIAPRTGETSRGGIPENIDKYTGFLDK